MPGEPAGADRRMTGGYTLQQVAGELDINPRLIKVWIEGGLLPKPGRGIHAPYDDAFIRRARKVHTLYQIWPRGPRKNIRTLLDGSRENVMALLMHDPDERSGATG